MTQPPSIEHAGPEARSSFAARKLAWIAIATVALVYLAGVTGQWWPSADSARYLGLARSLAAGEGYKFNGHPDSSVGPGLPLVLAGLMKATGEDYWAPNLLVALCGLATIGVAYVTIRRHRGTFVAACAAWGTAASYTFYFGSHRILTDVPFALLWWGCLYFAFKSTTWRSAAAAALLATAAIVVRLPGVALVLLTAVGLAIGRQYGPRLRSRLATAGAIAMAPGALLAALLLAAPVSAGEPLYLQLLRRHAQLPAWRLWNDVAGGLLALPNSIAELVTGQDGGGFWVVGLLIAALLVIGAAAGIRRRDPLPALLVLAYPLGIVLAGGERAAQPRYLLAILPWIVAVCADALAVLVNLRWKGQAAQKTWRAVALGLLAAATAINAPKILRHAVYYSYLSHTDRYYRVIDHGHFQELVQLGDWARRNTDRNSVVAFCGQPSVFCYLSDRRVVELPRTSQRYAGQAKAAMASLPSQADIWVIEIADARPTFTDVIRGGMRAKSDMKLFHDGKLYIGYKRVTPATSSAPTQPASRAATQGRRIVDE